MNIAIGAASLCLGKGGTERVAVNLAHAMLARGHTIHIFAYEHGRDPVFPLDARISLLRLPKEFGHGKHCEIEKVREYLKSNDIDVMLSLQSQWAHMLWCLTCLGTGVPIICSERSDPRFSEAVTWNRPGRMAVLACADAIHELVEAHMETVPEIHRHKCRVIPNAAPLTSIRADVGLNYESGTVLFLARFIPGKRADLLLKAFAGISGRFPEWRLRIVGYGREEKKLRELAASLGIGSVTEFVLHPENVFLEYEKASIYCLPTQVEGFPNSLIEAMACGLPVAGIADCPAMRSIIRDHDNGILVAAPDADLLGNALAELMSSPALRQKLAEKGLEDCAGVYNQEAIWDEWESFLRQVSEKKGAAVMDGFRSEPFASMATLSSAARREYLYRNFGEPMPWSWPFFRLRGKNLSANLRNGTIQGCKDLVRNTVNTMVNIYESVRLAQADWRKLPGYYRQIAKRRRMIPRRSQARTRAFCDHAVRFISLKNRAVLCVGCGSPEEVLHMRRMGADAVGIDLNGAEPLVHSMDMENLNFSDAVFDVVYSCHSLEHCEDQRAAAAEMIRVCKPGGHVCIEVPVNAVPDSVDLHTCPEADAVRVLFADRIERTLVEEFISLNDPRNGSGEDVFRFIYQVR
ncbi:glycosyltransferase [Desulfovibrio sp. ZJ369]|uniref:glycosyltransferase n=1 Tax=Desulfovibrio sp. ZJ369 TaxID=2709793 RepID=UPI0013EB4BE2|nr:glycosyltransferase [Desulfovibrio sp. ZJ369]